jgi:hypothetical protein
MVVHVSNGKVANNLMVIVDTKDSASDDVANTLAAWVVRHVNTQWPVENSNYPHGLVVGIQDRDVASEVEVPELSRVVLMVHQSTNEHGFVGSSDYDEHTLIVQKERPMPTGILDPNTLLERLIADTNHVEISAVGVSGVSDDFAKEMWAEIVSTQRQWMNGSGGGYMVHPMWLYDEQAGVHTIREMSFNFGWGEAYAQSARRSS